MTILAFNISGVKKNKGNIATALFWYDICKR